ncbi:armadillo-type protein [Cokeromyces recurvatus]|uniref:armadillo-type protein n=1 Tax=Cokeromyces recurvatus TaxID=90255 RepID=UPI00221FFD8E|nr:armadillo-type protein [Cokeromyces recurvatus]KAI7900271.1 armadillo-type protein [Cokeromyces recurvatus]
MEDLNIQHNSQLNEQEAVIEPVIIIHNEQENIKIYLFLIYYRLIITKELSSILYEINLKEALEVALPIIIHLSNDKEESIREKLAEELGNIMLFYYKNAPPLLVNSKTVMTTEETPDDSQIVDHHHHQQQQLHIPQHTFSFMIIDFLLDQNTATASYAQQSVVTIAAELLLLADKNSEKYQFYRDLLHLEIYEGIVLGLIRIFDYKLSEDETNYSDHRQLSESIYNEDSSVLGKTASSIMLKNEESEGNYQKGGHFSILVPSVATNFILHNNYDHSGINLAKMVCLMLMSALMPIFGSEGYAKKFLPIIESMVTDSMFYVRKEAATALGILANTVTLDITLEKLLPLFLKLSMDTTWHVRRSCVLALPLFCSVLPKDKKREIAIKSVEHFNSDFSRNVRYSLTDIIGELISKFLPTDEGEEVLPKELLDYFLFLCGGNNDSSSSTQFFTSNRIGKIDTTEQIHNCAYNFPAVVLTAGVNYWDSHLKDIYLQLTRDYQFKVRRTFAYSLHEIARIIGPERTERDLVQIFALYLMDLDEVKQGVIEHLSDFLAALTIESRNEYIPILAEVWDGVLNNWHLRHTLTYQLRDIAKLFDATRVIDSILPLAIKFCHDEIAAIREAGVDIFPIILDIVKRAVDDENRDHLLSEYMKETNNHNNHDLYENRHKHAFTLLNHVMEEMNKFVTSDAYRSRLVFAHICQSLLLAGITPTDFASFFLTQLEILSRDQVVNVRIATSRVIHILLTTSGYKQELYTMSHTDKDKANPGDLLDQILYNLVIDKEDDVRSFIIGVINEKDILSRFDKMTYPNKEDNEEKATSYIIRLLPTPPPISSHISTVTTIKSHEEESENKMIIDKENLTFSFPMDIVVVDDENLPVDPLSSSFSSKNSSVQLEIHDEDLIMNDIGEK